MLWFNLSTHSMIYLLIRIYLFCGHEFVFIIIRLILKFFLSILAQKREVDIQKLIFAFLA